MLIYILIFLLAFVFLLNENTNNSQRYVRFLFIIIFVIMGLRDYSVGTDTLSYIQQYEDGSSYLRSVDVGFTKYNQFLAGVGVSSRLFLILSSFIILFPVYLFVKNNSVNKSLVTLLYLTIGTFSMHMTGIRQSMAMGICLLGCVLFLTINRKYLKYIVLAGLIAMATTIHRTAIVCYFYIPMFLLANVEFKFKKLTLVLLLAIPIAAVFLSSYFSGIVNYFMISKYEDYELGSDNINVIAFWVIPYCIFLFLTWAQSKFGLSNKVERFCYLSAFLYVMASSASMYMPMLARMGYYFSLPMLTLVGNYCEKYSVANTKLIRNGIVVICILFFLISTSGGILQLDHYHFGF